jgi:putative ABC transport system ATP-binding protein
MTPQWTAASHIHELRQAMLLVTQALSKRVQTSDRELTILDGVSLEIAAEERVAIVGASGSGKSTLLSLLAGLDEPTDGSVIYHGRDNLSNMSEAERAAFRAEWIGFVFQSFQLLSSLTAIENVMLPLELNGEGRASEKAREWLDRVGLSHRLTHYPRQLSGGEQQRVAIARAFAMEPRVLFADEPTGNLDTATGQKVVELLFEINRDAGTTLILVTHDANLAQQCDRSIRLEAGKVVDSIAAEGQTR